jgi:hypothetical protein
MGIARIACRFSNREAIALTLTPAAGMDKRDPTANARSLRDYDTISLS